MHSRIFTLTGHRALNLSHRAPSVHRALGIQGSTILRWSTSQAKSTPIPHDPLKTSSCCSSKMKSSDDESKASSGVLHNVNPSAKKSALSVSSLQFWADKAVWATASTNTFRCLIGCTVGDMGMLFYLQTYHPTLSPGIAMAMAMTSGVLTSISLETVLLRFSRRSNMTWKSAFSTATGMSLISMLTMEAVENAVDFHLMGWNNVDLSNPVFWQAIGWSALAGWSAPLPFNYWRLKKHGKSCH